MALDQADRLDSDSSSAPPSGEEVSPEDREASLADKEAERDEREGALEEETSSGLERIKEKMLEKIEDHPHEAVDRQEAIRLGIPFANFREAYIFALQNPDQGVHAVERGDGEPVITLDEGLVWADSGTSNYAILDIRPTSEDLAAKARFDRLGLPFLHGRLAYFYAIHNDHHLHLEAGQLTPDPGYVWVGKMPNFAVKRKKTGTIHTPEFSDADFEEEPSPVELATADEEPTPATTHVEAPPPPTGAVDHPTRIPESAESLSDSEREKFMKNSINERYADGTSIDFVKDGIVFMYIPKGGTEKDAVECRLNRRGLKVEGRKPKLLDHKTNIDLEVKAVYMPIFSNKYTTLIRDVLNIGEEAGRVTSVKKTADGFKVAGIRLSRITFGEAITHDVGGKPLKTKEAFANKVEVLQAFLDKGVKCEGVELNSKKEITKINEPFSLVFDDVSQLNLQGGLISLDNLFGVVDKNKGALCESTVDAPNLNQKSLDDMALVKQGTATTSAKGKYSMSLA